MMIEILKSWREKRRNNKRYQKVLKTCGCVCRCPSCDNILNDQAQASDLESGLVRYKCSCGVTSEWDFDFPAPIFLEIVEDI